MTSLTVGVFDPYGPNAIQTGAGSYTRLTVELWQMGSHFTLKNR